MGNIAFACPKCGNVCFKTGVEVHELADFVDAVCSSCGYAVTEDDVRLQAIKLAEKPIKGIIK